MAYEAHALLTAALFPATAADLRAHARACLANRIWETDAFAWLQTVTPAPAPPPPILKQRGRKSREARNLHSRLQTQLQSWAALYRAGVYVRRVTDDVGLGLFAGHRLTRHTDIPGLRGWISNAEVPGCGVLLLERAPGKGKGLRRVQRSAVGPLALVNHACVRCRNLSPFAAAEAGLYEAVGAPESKPKTEFRQGSTLRGVKPGEQLLLHYGGTTRFPCLVCGKKDG